MATNLSIFNDYMIEIFYELNKNFPLAVSLNSSTIREKCGLINDGEYEFVDVPEYEPPPRVLENVKGLKVLRVNSQFFGVSKYLDWNKAVRYFSFDLPGSKNSYEQFLELIPGELAKIFEFKKAESIERCGFFDEQDFYDGLGDFVQEAVNYLWDHHSWNDEIKIVEDYLDRRLIQAEIKLFKSTAQIPKRQDLLNYESAIRHNKNLENQKSNDIKKLEKIFLSTIVFLCSEGFIKYQFRNLNVASNLKKIHADESLMIELNLNKLDFVLTSKGFSQLNKRVEGLNLSEEETLFKRMMKQRFNQGSQALSVIDSFTSIFNNYS